MRRVVCGLLVLLVAAGLFQAVWQHGRLPERVAVHFDLSGRPNGWMSRDAHLGAHVALLLFMGGVFSAGAWVLKRAPVELINVPHRDHWFSGERREESAAWLAGMLQAIGCAVVTFLIVVFDAVYRANTATGGGRLASVEWAIGGLLAVIAITVVLGWRRFARPRQA